MTTTEEYWEDCHILSSSPIATCETVPLSANNFFFKLDTRIFNDLASLLHYYIYTVNKCAQCRVFLKCLFRFPTTTVIANSRAPAAQPFIQTAIRPHLLIELVNLLVVDRECFTVDLN